VMKIIPLTYRRDCSSVMKVVTTCELDEGRRCHRINSEQSREHCPKT
jgi:hypothetical protein